MPRFSLGLSDRLFDVRAFALAFGVSLFLLVAGTVLVPGPFGFAGPAVGGAVVARDGRRRYLEVALAGALAAGAGVVLGYALAQMGDPSAAAIGTGTGTVAALAGHYIARQFRSCR